MVSRIPSACGFRRVRENIAHSVCGKSEVCLTAFVDSNILLRTFAESPTLHTEEMQGFYSSQTYQSVPRKVCRSSVNKSSSDAAARFITVIIPGQNVASRQIAASFTEAFSAHRTAVNVSIDSKSYQLYIDF